MRSYKSVRSEREIEEAKRSVEDRAEEYFDRLIHALQGEPVILPFVRVDRPRILDPLHKGKVDDPRSAPMIVEVRLTISPPTQTENKYTADAGKVYDLFTKLILAEMSSLKKRQGKFFKAMRTAKVGKLKVDILDLKKRQSNFTKRRQEFEHVLPRDAR